MTAAAAAAAAAEKLGAGKALLVPGTKHLQHLLDPSEAQAAFWVQT